MANFKNLQTIIEKQHGTDVPKPNDFAADATKQTSDISSLKTKTVTTAQALVQALTITTPAPSSMNETKLSNGGPPRKMMKITYAVNEHVKYFDTKVRSVRLAVVTKQIDETYYKIVNEDDKIIRIHSQFLEKQ